MDIVIASVIVVGLMVVMEIKVYKHEKPIIENIKEIQSLSAIAKPLNRDGHGA